MPLASLRAIFFSHQNISQRGRTDLFIGVVVDANWHHLVARGLMRRFSVENVRVAFEPVSVAKSGAIFNPSARHGHGFEVYPQHIIDLATPNQHELAAMHASAKDNELFESQDWWEIIDALGIPDSGARDRFVSLAGQKWTDQGVPIQSIQLLPFIPTILTKLGADGVLLTELLRPDDPRLTDPDESRYILSRQVAHKNIGGVYMRLFPPAEVVEDAVSVNGVGDTFLGVLIAGLARGLKLDKDLIHLAQTGAILTLRSYKSVSPKLRSLQDKMNRLLRIQSPSFRRYKPDVLE